MARKTKIIATIGPSLNSKELIDEIIDAGANVLRLNFSHGSHADHKKVVEWARSSNKNIAIMQDIQGPKIRTGTLEKAMQLERNNEIKLSNNIKFQDEAILINYEKLFQDVNEGERVLIDDGKIVLRVSKKTKTIFTAIVEVGGELRSNQGVAFPDSSLSLSTLTDKDKEDLEFGNQLNVDFVAVSFVRNADDILNVKKLINSDTMVIAKIELKAAVKNLKAIIKESDGIMVARGDLGVQLPLEQIPLIQKEILNESNLQGKITITATEMLTSMITSFRPTRAEVSDITNAIIDGTDSVMLSAETSIGDNPILAVQVMANICEEVDETSNKNYLNKKDILVSKELTNSLSKAAVQVANDSNAKAIVAFTETGRTPLLISNHRPDAPIFTFTSIDKTYNQLNLFWGVEQIKINRLETTDEMFSIANEWLKDKRNFKKNDKVVIVAGTPPNKEAATNLIRVMMIGEY
tara:strand:+ start:691 stop:2085 length:1395 start_codon:yes stop_codon:yes gene_type:complete